MWLNATVHNFREYVAYHPKVPTTGTFMDASVPRRKLLLMEDEAQLRKLMQEATDVWPPQGGEEQYELYLEINSDPDFSYEPFDNIIAEIMERIRATRPKK